jgi:hypothetical protein
MSIVKRIILRSLMSPFLFCIIFIKYNYLAISHTILAIRYGGEWINYSSDCEQKTIKDIYDKIKPI